MNKKNTEQNGVALIMSLIILVAVTFMLMYSLQRQTLNIRTIHQATNAQKVEKAADYSAKWLIDSYPSDALINAMKTAMNISSINWTTVSVTVPNLPNALQVKQSIRYYPESGQPLAGYSQLTVKDFALKTEVTGTTSTINSTVSLETGFSVALPIYE